MPTYERSELIPLATRRSESASEVEDALDHLITLSRVRERITQQAMRGSKATRDV